MSDGQYFARNERVVDESYSPFPPALRVEQCMQVRNRQRLGGNPVIGGTASEPFCAKTGGDRGHCSTTESAEWTPFKPIRAGCQNLQRRTSTVQPIDQDKKFQVHTPAGLWPGSRWARAAREQFLTPFPGHGVVRSLSLSLTSSACPSCHLYSSHDSPDNAFCGENAKFGGK